MNKKNNNNHLLTIYWVKSLCIVITLRDIVSVFFCQILHVWTENFNWLLLTFKWPMMAATDGYRGKQNNKRQFFTAITRHRSCAGASWVKSIMQQVLRLEHGRWYLKLWQSVPPTDRPTKEGLTGSWGCFIDN